MASAAGGLQSELCFVLIRLGIGGKGGAFPPAQLFVAVAKITLRYHEDGDWCGPGGADVKPCT